jgi:mannose-6-phosphate isomerase-like protein (cupin superfamily)
LDAGVPYSVLRKGDQAWVERPPMSEGGPTRDTLDVTTPTGLAQSRARMWRLRPGARGRRHAERVQEEVFFVVSGTLTMLLGDPPDRVVVSNGEIVTVQPGTGIQMHNTGDADVVVFAYGAPPVTGEVDYLDDVEL